MSSGGSKQVKTVNQPPASGSPQPSGLFGSFISNARQNEPYAPMPSPNQAMNNWANFQGQRMNTWSGMPGYSGFFAPPPVQQPFVPGQSVGYHTPYGQTGGGKGGAQTQRFL